MGIRVGLTLFSVVAVMIIFGMNQDAYAGSFPESTVVKITTSGDGTFTFDLFSISNLITPSDTCSINTQIENSCILFATTDADYLVIERAQAGFVQVSTTCPGVLPGGIGVFSNCEFVNSPKLAVGGDIIPLDTTMVLVAGTQTTAAWMIPVIVSAIGIGIVIARKF